MPPTNGSKTTKQEKNLQGKKQELEGLGGKVGNQARNLRGGGDLGDKGGLE